MKYLKIENNKAFFNKEDAWVEIDLITKEDLENLLNCAVNESFELDDFDIALLGNKAHQIIYKHLYEKFNAFLQNKNRFIDEADNLYKEALAKYK